MATTITANGINFPDGSAGSPSIGGTDTNTGLFTGSDIVGFATGGSERLRIDASGNVNIANDSGKLQLGTGDDLQIYHSGSHSYIAHQGTGNLFVEIPESQKFQIQHGAEAILNGYADGRVELYYDNSKKFETTTDGVQVTGEVVSGTLHCSGKLDLPDSSGATVGRVLLGDSDDLQLYHDGSDSFIDDSGTGNLFIRSSQLQINKYTGENMIKAVADGAVELYHDNVKCLETRSDGGIEATDGNFIVGTAGHGIQFDTADSGSDQLLDDYEEGTFSPTVTQGGSVSSYGTQIGRYIKIGRQVHWQIYMAMTGTGNGDGLKIGSFPFTSATYNTHGYGGGTMGYAANTFQTDNMYMYFEQNSTDLTFRERDGTIIAGNSGNIFGNADFILFGQYISAS